MIKNIILLIFSMIVAVLMIWLTGEIALRHGIRYDMADTPEMYVKSENKILKKELKPDYKGVYYGYAVEINSKGFRDYEYDINKPEGVYRIALLGDSMCFGQGLPLSDIYPKVLERLLNNNKPHNITNIKKIEVLNFSIPGHNTAQEYEYLKTKAALYKPDLIILNFFLNDILPTPEFSSGKSQEKQGFSLHNRFVDIIYFVKEGSYFFQFVLSRVATLARRIGVHRGYISEFRSAYATDNKDWIKCQREILNIKGFAEDIGPALLVVVIPFLSDLKERHPLKNELDTVTGFCKKNNIDTLNLFPHFYGYKPESLWINPINGHPNTRAHQIMAEAVSNYILNEVTENVF